MLHYINVFGNLLFVHLILKAFLDFDVLVEILLHEIEFGSHKSD